jgi:hypothetical protein
MLSTSRALRSRRTGDWPAEPTPGDVATFGEVWLAVVWLAGVYGKVREELLLPGVLLEERLEAALDLLPRGVDVRWGEWLQGGRFVTIGVVCCPNRHVLLPCLAYERAAAVPTLTARSTVEAGS